MPPPASVMQNILPKYMAPTSLPVRPFSRRQAGDLAVRISELKPKYLGIALKQHSDATIELAAFATVDAIYTVSFEPGRREEVILRDDALKSMLCGTLVPTMRLVGFNMARIALHVIRDFRLHVRGVDLATLCSPSTREPLLPDEFLSKRVHSGISKKACRDLWGNICAEEDDTDVCIRAWLSAKSAEACGDEVTNSVQVDTRLLNKAEMACLSQLAIQCDLLEVVKPNETPNSFDKNESKFQSTGLLQLQNSRYRDRVRPSRRTEVIAIDASGRQYIGRARASQGRKTDVKFAGGGPKTTEDFVSIKVIGRYEYTNSEKARDEFMLLVLCGKKNIKEWPILRVVWFPSNADLFALQKAPRAIKFPDLNPAQSRSASDMVSDCPVVITHGPPGTGKTTTIAASVAYWRHFRRNVWLIAHSNVAVKNIAETLFKKGLDFKIIVSKEFYVEWHEHYYVKIVDHLIRADEIPTDQEQLLAMFGESTVILATLSMLSNPVLTHRGVFRLVPVETLVVDEASQINIVEYMHIFGNLKRLRKVCFFGDPKQLPPYGQDRISLMKSIFDVRHIKVNAHFLDTQYRMPIFIGNFISQKVYGGMLQSQHRTQGSSCVAFIDIYKGLETKSGFSYVNKEEIQTVVNLVGNYYQGTNFCVITPYDAQRAAIERQLKDQGLPWERVFNVDSFQGNEADYVIISVVRTQNAGFLSSLHRMNVMLTRCRAGLVMVTNREFLSEGGRSTLLGALAIAFEASRGRGAWVDWRRVAEDNANLPGFVRSDGSRRNPSQLIVSPWSETFPETPSSLTHGRRPSSRMEEFPSLLGNKRRLR